MKTLSCVLLHFCLLLFAFGVTAQTVKTASAQPNTEQTEKGAKMPEIRVELLKRLKASRELRMELVKNNNSAGVEQLVKTDQENTLWVKSAIEKYGWLGNTLVGKDGQEAAFKLVMYAIQDPGFQKQYFELLQNAVKDGEAPAAQLALLTDRFLVSEGKPQRYGTQTRVTKEGKFEVPPIEDEANVDKRRAEVGLGTLAEYIERMRQTYSKSNN